MDGQASVSGVGPNDGFKEVRHRVIDLDAPGVREEIVAAVGRINASEEEANILAEIESMTAELWSTIPE